MTPVEKVRAGCYHAVRYSRQALGPSHRLVLAQRTEPKEQRPDLDASVASEKRSPRERSPQVAEVALELLEESQALERPQPSAEA